MVFQFLSKTRIALSSIVRRTAASQNEDPESQHRLKANPREWTPTVLSVLVALAVATYLRPIAEYPSTSALPTVPASEKYDSLDPYPPWGGPSGDNSGGGDGGASGDASGGYPGGLQHGIGVHEDDSSPFTTVSLHPESEWLRKLRRIMSWHRCSTNGSRSYP